MKQRFDNIYFVLSVLFLTTMLLIIFYMYQQKYKFDELMDLKTLLQVVGTIGGAFLGAYLAGRYNADQTAKQIQHNRDLNQEQSLALSIKYSKTATVLVMTAKDEISNLVISLKENGINVEASSITATIDSLEYLSNRIKALNTINSLELEMYEKIFRSTNILDSFIYSFKKLLLNYNKENLQYTQEYYDKQFKLLVQHVEESMSICKKEEQELKTLKSKYLE